MDASKPGVREAPAGAGELALGKALREQQRHEEATPLLRTAIEAAPELCEAHFELGLALLLQQQAALSEKHFERTLDLDPGHQLARLNLGNAHHNQGRFEAALDHYRLSLAAGPPSAMGFNNIGRALQNLGRVEEAIAAYKQGLELSPTNRRLLGNLESAYEQRPEATISACSEPGSVETQLEHSKSLRKQGDLEGAVQAAQQALELDPGAAWAHFHLGAARQEQGRHHDAVNAFKAAIASDPRFSSAYSNLAGALKSLGLLEPALEHWRQAVAISPEYPAANSNLLLCLNYQANFSATEVSRAHRAWGQAVTKRAGEPTEHDNDRTADRRLRVGYLSPDLFHHPVAAFLEPILAAHDSEAVEVTCYASSSQDDEVTCRLREHAHHWRRVQDLKEPALEAAIRADGIDILFDLSGHTGGSRLGLFSRKPAPVQVSYIGYPNTTGLEAIDWRITDHHADPAGMTESLHTERLARLPHSFLCYAAPEAAPEVRTARYRSAGYFDFACFNNLIKIGPSVVSAWARILIAAPKSRLLIKNAALADSQVRQRVEKQFSELGVSPDRLQLMGRVGRTTHLNLYNQVGLNLDTFPYNGTATTFEASWMGVPTLTLAGDRHAGRVGVSHNLNLELPELVTGTLDGYIAQAVELASDQSCLRQIKFGLRERLSDSPLMDRVGTTRALEEALRNMWRGWCL